MLENLLEDMFKNTPLHDAVEEGDLEQVRRLLHEGADVNARAFFNVTPLMTACGSGTAKMHSAMKQMGQQTAEEAEATRKKTAEFFNMTPGPGGMPRLDTKRMLAEMSRKRTPDDTLPDDDPALALLLIEHGADVNAVDQSGHSPLMQAVRAGRAHTADVLLAHGADIYARDSDDLTALMIAAQARRLECIALLLDRGADADARTNSGGTTLMAAAEGGRVEIARLLMARGQDVNTQSVNGQTALLRALFNQQDDMTAFLRGAGAHVGFLEAVALGDEELAASLPVPDAAERGPKWGYASLLWAIKYEQMNMVRLLLSRGVSANADNKSGQPALMFAVMRGHEPIVRLLLDAGADPGGRPNSHITPLSWAAKHGETEIMNLLLERGADVEATRPDGGSNLSGSVMFGNVASSRRLLEVGADANGKVSDTTSLLEFATIRNDKDMVALLLEFGARPEKNAQGVAFAKAMARDKPEIQAMFKQVAGVSLHELAKAGKVEELQTHLDAGMDINARGDLDETPLIAALRGKQTDTALFLIKGGADISLIDRAGQSALVCAAMGNNIPVARLLAATGADISIVDKWGQTALLWAALGGHLEIVALLTDAGARVGAVEAAVLGDIALLRHRLNEGDDVDTRSSNGMTPLMGASARGHLDCITALLTRRADINATDEQGKTALAWAAMYKRLDAARLLLDEGADVNHAGEDLRHLRMMEEIRDRVAKRGTDTSMLPAHEVTRGSFPLHMAALHDDSSMAALLLENGANINLTGGILEQTPLASSAMLGRIEMVRFLLAQGADASITNQFGNTALQDAEQSGKNPDVVALLKAHVSKPEQPGDTNA